MHVSNTRTAVGIRPLTQTAHLRACAAGPGVPNDDCDAVSGGVGAARGGSPRVGVGHHLDVHADDLLVLLRLVPGSATGCNRAGDKPWLITCPASCIRAIVFSTLQAVRRHRRTPHAAHRAPHAAPALARGPGSSTAAGTARRCARRRGSRGPRWGRAARGRRGARFWTAPLTRRWSPAPAPRAWGCVTNGWVAG